MCVLMGILNVYGNYKIFQGNFKSSQILFEENSIREVQFI